MNNYLEKGLYVIEKYSKQLSMLPNDVKLGINVIDSLDTDYFMGGKHQFLLYQTPLKLHIQKNMHFLYKQDFYKYEQKEIDDLIIENPCYRYG